IEINPYNVEANINLGDIYIILLDHDKALEYYEKAEKYSKNINIKSNIDKIYYGIGYISYHKKLYLKALNNLIKSHKLGNEEALSIIEKIDMPEAKEYIKNRRKL
uniref:tetratricopeptide repeat protein n=1 Tax=Brachyspira sp. TaxID=1977261 RepID=UPI003D7D3196